MLQKLSIQNYALIDNIEISFDSKLNIITGETGAGKSILLGALALLLGQRAESKYFYSQTKKCIIEGHFKLNESVFYNQFQALDLDFEPISIIRREISMDGKSRAFINDTPVNLGILKQVSEKLIAIHTQHATFEINQTDFQFLILDSLANTSQEFQQYQQQFLQLKNYQNTLSELESAQENALKKQDYDNFLLNELLEANLKVNEQVQLEQELNKLNNIEHILSGLNKVNGILDGPEYAVLNLLKESYNQLSQIEKHDPTFSPFVIRLKEAHIELKDISADINQLESNYTINPARIEELTTRLDQIYNLQKKHRVNTIAELLRIQEALELSFEQHGALNDEIENLRKTIAELTLVLESLATHISNQRKSILETARMEILEKLIPLQLAHANLIFELTQSPSLGKYGYDQVQLLFNANQGQNLQPVNKIASGGELSRLMLAIKAVLAKHTVLATLVFDEIDTGISGEAAQKVANLLAELGESMQLITISHLPQIAAKGNSHYLVYKDQQNGKSLTYLKKLEPSERVFSIAQMLSGENPSQTALQHAQELLNF
ncbi:MAG: DNA repair protein RecN [Pedobacter sp.]|nr:MAG: DNA repair protein RecN [Pedobacter sp.]